MARPPTPRRRCLRCGLLGALVLPLAACHPAAPVPEPPPAVPTSAPPPSDAAGTASIAPVESAAPIDIAAPAAPAPPEQTHAAGPGRIGCGATTCSATTEVCCADTAHRHYACAKRRETPSPRLFEGAGGPVELDEPACVDATGARMDASELWFCDGSDDCAAGEVCCRQALRWTMCVHARGAPGGACDFGEACSEGSCRAREGICDDGMCRKARPSVACGGAVCTPGAPICCVDDGQRSCVPRAGAGCGGGSSVPMECRGPRDCLPGQRCCVAPGGAGTVCAGHCDNVDTPTCTTAADCKDVTIPFVEGASTRAPRCKLAPALGIGRCVPPWE